jgi:hypothetical protein
VNYEFGRKCSTSLSAGGQRITVNKQDNWPEKILGFPDYRVMD